MISILTTAANAILGLAITALKAFLSMFTWFLKLFFSLLKYLYCVLPVTAVVFCGLYFLNTFLLFSGSAGPDKISTEALSNERLEQTAQDFLKIGNSEVGYFSKELVTWWTGEMSKYKGTFSFVILLVISFVLLTPVVGVILGITVLFSYGKILMFAVAADMAFYIGFAILGKGFMSVMQNRYYRLFPDAGKRKVAREYAEWKKERKAAAAEDANIRNARAGLPSCVTPSLKRSLPVPDSQPDVHLLRLLPRIRSRLTLGRRSLPRNPYAFGGADSHRPFRYSCQHSHFLPVHSPLQDGFGPTGTLLYHAAHRLHP